MRHHHFIRAALLAAALGGITACRSDSVTQPGGASETSPSYSQGSGPTLVVDNDKAECPNAKFSTIQAAVAAAEPGTTILVCAGTYHEQVLIMKNDLRLLAKGQPGDVILDGFDLPTMRAGFDLQNAHGNLIEGFLIQNYHEAGIWLRFSPGQPTTGSSRNTIRKNVTTSSPFHDGIQLLNAPANMVEQNTTFANFSPMRIACGINVIGPLSDGNTVRHNESFANDFGIQVVGGADNNVIFENHSHDNRRVGIRNIAGNGTAIENNRVFDNGVVGEFGGIFLSASTGVTVARNKAFNNLPFDLFWDGVGANEFENNHCRVGVPPWLCEHTEGASEKK
jgi:parallel beta-helix repeat protein